MSTLLSPAEESLEKLEGALVASLKRGSTKIKADRALAIAESAELAYKRKVEDLTQDLKNLKREREAMLDMSPTDATSLVLAKDFNALDFVARDLSIGTRIREIEVMLEIATNRYNYLFQNKTKE